MFFSIGRRCFVTLCSCSATCQSEATGDSGKPLRQLDHGTTYRTSPVLVAGCCLCSCCFTVSSKPSFHNNIFSCNPTARGCVRVLTAPFAMHTQRPHFNSLSLTKKPAPLKLGASDTLKLTFQITENSEGKGVQPHQTFVRFYDSVSGEEGIQPVRVTPGGKAKFELVCLLLLVLYSDPDAPQEHGPSSSIVATHV